MVKSPLLEKVKLQTLLLKLFTSLSQLDIPSPSVDMNFLMLTPGGLCAPNGAPGLGASRIALSLGGASEQVYYSHTGWVTQLFSTPRAERASLAWREKGGGGAVWA